MNNSWSIKLGDSIYPKLLGEIYNPPQKLFYKGKLELLNKVCIGIVGTRRNTEYGEIMAEKIVEELSVLDIAIVSGLAKGIDAIAHKAALKNNLPTIAVLGSGINNIYPKSNNGLAEEIEKNGLIISEYEDQTEPIDFQFPQRNRIISGLSIAVIVIEAPERSGSLITAKLALDQNREIFTIPGDVDRETSIGPLKLIQNCGAYPVSSGREIIEILQKQPCLKERPPRSGDQQAQAQRSGTPQFSTTQSPPQQPPKSCIPKPSYNLTREQSAIFSLLSKRRISTLEKIQEKTSLPTEKILSTLSFLEIQGLVVTANNGYLQI
ncbi:MAG: DNA-processing protein DprA [Candidatus Gracilibacteria bacterium]|jgi:DNA processing protein